MRKLMLALGMAAIATPAVIVLPATSAQAQRHYSKGHHRHYAYKEWRGRDGRRYCRKSDGTVGWSPNASRNACSMTSEPGGAGTVLVVSDRSPS